MRRRQRSGIASQVSLPITPMLDMTFQLLFFLVLTLKPDAGKEGMFEAHGDANGTKPAPPTVSEPPRNVVENLTLVVCARSKRWSEARSVATHCPSTDCRVKALMPPEPSGEERRPEPPEAGRVRLKPDARLKYAFVMDVLDVCKRAGFSKMSFATPDS